MNINDVKIDWTRYEGKDPIALLFEKQEELRIAFGVPLCDLDVPADQQQLRAMAWNTIEEMGEALEAKFEGSHDHLLDELADMTAFYIELFLMSRIPRDQLPAGWGTYNKPLEVQWATMDFTQSLALAINTLKNRYWRKTNVKTDRLIYFSRLTQTWGYFTRLVFSLGVSTRDLLDAYLRKHEVNKFRIRSKY